MGLREWLDRVFGSADDHPCRCPPGTERRGAAPPEGDECWCETPEGVKHGPFRSWFEDGTPKAEGAYRDGKLHGPMRSYHEDGSPRVEPVGDARFIDGKAHGTWLTHHANGVLAKRLTVTAGEDDGLREEWHEDGTPKLRGQWRAGAPVGVHERWHANGAPAERGRWVSGEREGEWTEWDERGHVLSRGVYEAGRPTGEWTYRQADGVTPWKRGRYERGVPVGDWEVCDEQGRVLPPFAWTPEDARARPRFERLLEPAPPETDSDARVAWARSWLRSWTARVHPRRDEACVSIEVSFVPEPEVSPYDAPEIFGGEHPDMEGAYLVRVEVTPEGAAPSSAWHGSDDGCLEQPFYEYAPEGPTLQVPEAARVHARVELRVALIGEDLPEGSVALQLAGEASLVAPFAAPVALELEPRELVGELWRGPVVSDAPPATPAPPVARTPPERSRCVAVLPDLGWLCELGFGRRVHGFGAPPLRSRSPESELEATTGLRWRESTTSGPGGLVADVFSGHGAEELSRERRKQTRLHVTRWPAGELVCELGPDADVYRHGHGVFDARGRVFLFPIAKGRGMALLDLDTGEVRWRSPIDGYFSSNAKGIDAEGVHVVADGAWCVFDLKTGDRLRCEPLRVRSPTDVTQELHPSAGRVAWEYPISLVAEAASIVSWCDRSGGSGSALVPEEAWGSPMRLAVLDDGRIVVVVRSVWLVDPDDGSVRFLAPGDAHDTRRRTSSAPPLVIDRSPSGAHRSWSTDERAPLYLALE